MPSNSIQFEAGSNWNEHSKLLSITCRLALIPDSGYYWKLDGTF